MNFFSGHHLSVFTASLALNVTDSILAYLADAWTGTRGSRMIVPEDRRLLASYAQVDSPTRVQLSTATLELGGKPLLSYVVNGLNVPTQPPVNINIETGIILPANEDLGVLVTRAGVGAAQCTVGLWHTRQFRPVAPGPVKTVRATATITTVANTWTLGTLTLDSVLPPGRYTCVGARVIGATNVFVRFVIPGVAERAGVLCDVALANFQENGARFGAWGSLFSFDHLNTPQLEVFNTAAGAVTFEVHLDLSVPQRF